MIVYFQSHYGSDAEVLRNSVGVCLIHFARIINFDSECSIQYVARVQHTMKFNRDRGNLMDKGLMKPFNLYLTYVHSAYSSSEQFETLLA